MILLFCASVGIIKSVLILLMHGANMKIFLRQVYVFEIFQTTVKERRLYLHFTSWAALSGSRISTKTVYEWP